MIAKKRQFFRTMPTVFFVSFLVLVRLLVLISTEPSLSGDSAWYLAMSEEIANTGQLPNLTHKILGYPVYLSALWNYDEIHVLTFQARLNAVFDVVLILTVIFFIFKTKIRSNVVRLFLVAAIALQPFSSTLAHTLLSEPPLSLILFFSCILFGFSLSTTNRYISFLLIGISGLGIGCATLFRAEMLAITGITTLFLLRFILLRTSFSRKRCITTACLLLICSGLPIVCYVTMQAQSTGELGIAKNNYGWDGYYSWLRTWVKIEKRDYEPYAFGIAKESWRGYEMDSYPKTAFDSEREKYQIGQLIAKMKEEGYTESLDQEFQAVADQKAHSNILRTYVFLPLFRGFHYFINLEGTEFYFRVIELPRPVRLVLIASIMGVKAIILLLAAYGTWLTAFRFHKLKTYIQPFAVFSVSIILTRWMLLVGMSPFMVAGLMEARYVYILWPQIFLVSLIPFWRQKLEPNLIDNQIKNSKAL